MGMASLEDVVISTDAHSSIESMVNQARFIEELGFERISMGEANGYNVVPILTRISEATDRLGISNDVYSPYSRSPALIAQTAATLQEISGGRTRLGLGTSSPALAEKWHGGSFEDPLERLEETMRIIRVIQEGERVEFDGQFYQLSGMKLRTGPVDPPVPLDMAALGPGAVRLAGRRADGWVPQIFTPTGLKDRMEDLRAGAREENRSPEDIRVTFSLRCLVLDDAERARETARNHIAFMIGIYGPFYYQSLRRQGHEEQADRIRETFRESGREEAASTVSDELLDDLVAAGSVGRARETIERFAAIDGVDVIRVAFPIGCSLDDQENTLQTLSNF